MLARILMIIGAVVVVALIASHQEIMTSIFSALNSVFQAVRSAVK